MLYNTKVKSGSKKNASVEDWRFKKDWISYDGPSPHPQIWLLVACGGWHGVRCGHKVRRCPGHAAPYAHIPVQTHISTHSLSLSQNTGSQSQVSAMTVWTHSLILLALCLGLAAAIQEEGEGDARLLFSNYTSGITIFYYTMKYSILRILLLSWVGLLKLTTVNSTTYNLISLIVGGSALAVVFVYLLTASPTFQSQYRSFSDGESSIPTEPECPN